MTGPLPSRAYVMLRSGASLGATAGCLVAVAQASAVLTSLELVTCPALYLRESTAQRADSKSNLIGQRANVALNQKLLAYLGGAAGSQQRDDVQERHHNRPAQGEAVDDAAVQGGLEPAAEVFQVPVDRFQLTITGNARRKQQRGHAVRLRGDVCTCINLPREQAPKQRHAL